MNKQSDKCKDCLKNAKGRILPCEINKNDCHFIEDTKRRRRMKKVFISQPMNGLSDLQIEKDKTRVIEGLYNEGYRPDEITVIDTFIKENAPDNVNSGLWYLGKSLELLADADIAVFAKGWRNARGCQIEFKCAKEYGISYICED